MTWSNLVCITSRKPLLTIGLDRCGRTTVTITWFDGQIPTQTHLIAAEDEHTHAEQIDAAFDAIWRSGLDCEREDRRP